MASSRYLIAAWLWWSVIVVSMADAIALGYIIGKHLG